MPTLAGTYYSESEGDLGSGATKRNAVNRLGWFAIKLDRERILLRALSPDGIPTTISKLVSIKEFLADYLPDEELHSGATMPLFLRLWARLEAAGGALDETSTPSSLGLDKEEAALFKAMHIEAEHLPGLNARQRLDLVLEMLQAPPAFDAVATEHKRLANRESIASRKEGRYDEAISLYNAMLRAAPEDTHIFFNVARVHYDKNDLENCRRNLEIALERDPGFEEARRFLQHLDKRNAPAKL